MRKKYQNTFLSMNRLLNNIKYFLNIWKYRAINKYLSIERRQTMLMYRTQLGRLESKYNVQFCMILYMVLNLYIRNKS